MDISMMDIDYIGNIGNNVNTGDINNITNISDISDISVISDINDKSMNIFASAYIPRGENFINFIMQYSQPVYETSIYKTYCIRNALNIKFFVDNIAEYPYNPNLDITHINNIANQILRNPNFTAPIILGLYSDMTTQNPAEIIDGHHRIQALRKIFSERIPQSFPFELEIRVYYIDRPDGPLTQQLYEACNNSKPFKINMNIISQIRDNIIQKLDVKYPNLFRPCDKPHKPHLSSSQFAKCLYDILNVKFNNQSYQISKVLNSNITDLIIARFDEYNNKLKKMSTLELFTEFRIRNNVTGERKFDKWIIKCKEFGGIYLSVINIGYIAKYCCEFNI